MPCALRTLQVSDGACRNFSGDACAWRRLSKRVPTTEEFVPSPVCAGTTQDTPLRHAKKGAVSGALPGSFAVQNDALDAAFQAGSRGARVGFEQGKVRPRRQAKRGQTV